jgi:cell division protein FtsB
MALDTGEIWRRAQRAEDQSEIDVLKAKVAALEREVSELKTREAVIDARERQFEKLMVKVRAFAELKI